jgi:hypothetical protein
MLKLLVAPLPVLHVLAQISILDFFWWFRDVITGNTALLGG